MAGQTSAILWKNSTATVTLIDIPQSIASAQGTAQSPFPYRLLSTVPQSDPFPNIEPKSDKAKSSLEPDDEIHRQYQNVLNDALRDIRSQYQGSWCLPRPFTESTDRSKKRRRLSEDADGHQPSTVTGETTQPSMLPSDMLSRMAREESAVKLNTHQSSSCHADTTDSTAIPTTKFLTNTSPTTPSSLQLTYPLNKTTYTFHLPPNSTFSLSDCTNPLPFRKSLHLHAHKSQTRKDFDFILLDPPWPNRSVRRTHKTPGSTYAIASTASDIREMLLDMNVHLLMSTDCLVGVWITNKASIRDLVLAESGLFDCWDVELVEEWLWLKTTVSGEPVLPCDGVRRKPYEVLLLGRKRGRDGETAPLREGPSPKRRVIFAVPDLHSRKPCLKALIEPLMPARKDYRALEIFARYLVAGWCSWGNECIKFNWNGFWQTMTEDGEQSAKREGVIRLEKVIK